MRSCSACLYHKKSLIAGIYKDEKLFVGIGMRTVEFFYKAKQLRFLMLVFIRAELFSSRLFLLYKKYFISW